MDLDEMKQLWTEHDRKLEAILRLNKQLVTALNLNRARSALRRLAWLLAAESAIWLVLSVALWGFIHDHASSARFALPAACLGLYAILNLIALVRQIVVAVELDYTKPIATIQMRFESLRMLRLRYIQIAVLAGILAWTPLVIVLLKALLDIDAYQSPGAAWLWANFLFTSALVALAIGTWRTFRERLGRSPFMRGLMKDVEGYNLNAAAEFLATVSDAEHEKSAP